MSGPLDADAVRALAPGELYSLEGRAAIVTGAAGGLGRWFAAGLGAAGARVLVTDLEPAPVEGLVELLAGAGVEAAGVAVDLADEDAPEQLVAAAVERLGGVHVLVNNAAVNRRMPILEMDRETWDWITRIDLRLPYFLSQAAARRMIEQGEGGSIVSISSLSAVLRARADLGLRPGEGRPQPADEGDGARVGRARHPRERDRARVHGHSIWPRRSGRTTACAAGS